MGTKGRHRPEAAIAALAIALAAAAAASLMLGRYDMSVADVCRMLASRVAPIEQTWTAQQETLFFRVRLPRVILAIMVGCSLSSAGAAFCAHAAIAAIIAIASKIANTFFISVPPLFFS